MAPTPGTRDRLLKALVEVARRQGSEAERTAHLRRAFLDYVSQSPENLAAMQRIAVAETVVQPEYRRTGTDPAIAAAGISLADIACEFENLPMPPSIAEAFPGLTEADWDAFLRLNTILHLLLQDTDES